MAFQRVFIEPWYVKERDLDAVKFTFQDGSEQIFDLAGVWAIQVALGDATVRALHDRQCRMRPDAFHTQDIPIYFAHMPVPDSAEKKDP